MTSVCVLVVYILPGLLRLWVISCQNVAIASASSNVISSDLPCPILPIADFTPASLLGFRLIRPSMYVKPLTPLFVVGVITKSPCSNHLSVVKSALISLNVSFNSSFVVYDCLTTPLCFLFHSFSTFAISLRISLIMTSALRAVVHFSATNAFNCETSTSPHLATHALASAIAWV